LSAAWAAGASLATKAMVWDFATGAALNRR
jgi:hypothetical protein